MTEKFLTYLGLQKFYELIDQKYIDSSELNTKIAEKVAEIVAGAPEDFDTLKEISDWISSHEDSAAAMNSAIQENAQKIEDKVDKVAGKGLSTNDYTTAEKTKLGNCKTVWEGTQTEYDALVSKTYDLYMIYEDEEETEVENQNGD